MDKLPFTRISERAKGTSPDISQVRARTADGLPGSAFTLTELLVVMGVVGLFCLLILPALAGTADRSKRARCQNNLRQIAMGVTMYAGNNHGRVISAKFSVSEYVQIVLEPPGAAAAAQVGLSFETNGVWTCPNRPGLPLYEASLSQWDIGYQYFGGIKTWHNTLGYFSSCSPTNLNTAQPHWALAADTVMKVNGSWGGSSIDLFYSNLPPHHAEDSVLPQGGNQAFVDGSVQWIQAEKMYFLSSWSLSARIAFWYQDPKDFPFPKNMLQNLRFAP